MVGFSVSPVFVVLSWFLPLTSKSNKICTAIYLSSCVPYLEDEEEGGRRSIGSRHDGEGRGAMVREEVTKLHDRHSNLVASQSHQDHGREQPVRRICKDKFVLRSHVDIQKTLRSPLLSYRDCSQRPQR